MQYSGFKGLPCKETPETCFAERCEPVARIAEELPPRLPTQAPHRRVHRAGSPGHLGYRV